MPDKFLSSSCPRKVGIVVLVLVAIAALAVVWSRSESPPYNESVEDELASAFVAAAEEQEEPPQIHLVESQKSISFDQTTKAEQSISDLPRVVIVRRTRHSPDRTSPLASRLEALQDAAESGNPDAALELAGGLAECANAPRNQDALDEKINTLYQTRMVETSTVPIDNLYEVVQELRDNYQYFEGISQDQVLDHYTYMKLAADNGNLEAKSRLTRYGPMPEDEIFVALRRAWVTGEDMVWDEVKHQRDAAMSGDADAILDYGTLTAEPMFNVEKTESVAFRLAGLHLKILAGDDTAWFEQELKNLQLTTGKNDMEAAIERAKQILESDRCCYRLK